MKMNLKNSVLPRLLALVFAFVLLLTAAAIPVAAAKSGYTEWDYDATTRTLTATFPDGDTEVYYRVEDSIHLRYDPDYSYKYYNSVRIDGSSYKIYATAEGGDTLALFGLNEDWIFFVTEKQLDEVEDLYATEGSQRATLSHDEADNHLHHTMGKSFLKDLRELTADPSAETLTDTLYGLRYAPRYELWLYDKATMIAVNEGFLFDLAGEMYYVGVRDLPAAALDEEGKIIPSESVSVTLYRLPKELEEEAYYAVYTASAHFTYDLENEGSYMGSLTEGTPAPVAFVYFTIAILGIAVPIAPIVLGLCLPHSAKQGYKKRWYLLSILGGAWMLLGILVLVMMIVAL